VVSWPLSECHRTGFRRIWTRRRRCTAVCWLGAGVAAALNGLGYSTALVGDAGTALEYCQQALAIFQQIDDPWAEALTWHSLGYAHHRAGQHASAAECYQEALRLLRAYGDRYNPATVLTHLGDAYHAGGDTVAARESWHAALSILTKLQHPDADAVRAKLELVP
jgi:tetratricopeptide (TPR) repeat protein